MIKDIFRIEIEAEQKMCDKCMRRDSDFFETKIQIRYPNIIEADFRDEIEKSINSILNKYKDLINKVSEKENKNNKEVDINLRKNISYNSIYNLLNKDFLVTFKKSNKLVGFDKERSKNRYKHTFLFEISEIKKDDIVLFKGKKYKVKTFFKNNITLVDLDKGSKKSITYSINKDFIKKL